MNLAKWDRRIQRAEELEAEHPFAADVLRFYQGATALQKELYRYSHDSAVTHVDALLTKFPEFLSNISRIGPEPIAQCAREWKTQGDDPLQELLQSHWRSTTHGSSPEALLAWLFLQPYAEYMAERSESEPRHKTAAACPVCARKPVVGVLRPEGDGAKRSLICSMCATEWRVGRILCTACGEDNVEKLAIYTAEQFGHVRVEACDNCGCYIKTVDLTKSGRPVPVVDELATIPLNLWAREHHYVKVQANMLGI